MTEVTQSQPPGHTTAVEPNRGLSLAQQVLIALVLAIVSGVFFGDTLTWLKPIGEIYIGLLQMMVLPYIIFSLIGGIGKLTVEQAKELARYALLFLLLMWAMIGTVLLLLPLALPELVSASFYSSSLLEPARDSNLLNIFIPNNVFASLNNNHVPAVVVFCIAMGIALITAKDKQEVFKLFDVLEDAVKRVITFVVRLTPLGVFAMTTPAAGTMGFDELGRLQGYFILFTVAVLIMSFWLLPGLIVSLTPFRYKDIISIAWPAMALGLAAPKILVALPLIIEGIKQLFERYEVRDQKAVTAAEMLVPLSYPFPQTGKLLELFFIPFAAWFIGTPLAFGDYPVFLTSGLLSLFGSTEGAIPFLLDLMQLPADMFQIFLITDVYTGPISHLLRVMDMFTLAVLVACAASGMLQLRWRRVILVIAIAVGVLAVAIVGVRTYLGQVSAGAYDKDKVISAMQLMEEIVPAVIVEAAPNPVSREPGQSHLDRIKERGVIRVGYDLDRLPFSYTNTAGKLVGFDIDMAQRLAQELGVTIEFVPFDFDTLSQQLNADHFDIAMSGTYGTVEQSGNIRISDPYMFVNMALVVPDYRDHDFATPQAIQDLDHARIGIHRSLAGEEFIKSATAEYPNVEFVVLNSYRDFFEQTGAGKGLHALYTGAESGSAWTLLFPTYQVVTPWADDYSVPLVYPYSHDQDDKMDEFIDHWVLLKQNDGTVQEAYDYWILGQGAESKEPRWSIIRDVLGWVE